MKYIYIWGSAMKFINNFFKLLVMFFLVLSVFKDNTLLVRGEETNKLQNKLQKNFKMDD